MKTEYKKQCPECKVWYGRKLYANGTIQAPFNFKRAVTCGDDACVQASRRRKRAAERVEEARAVEAVDIFIYGQKAIAAYHALMR